MLKHCYFYIGTVAELIKLIPVMKRLRENNISFSIIASGQNDIARETELLRLAKAEDVEIINLNRCPNHQTAVSLFAWFFKTFFKGFFIFRKKFSRKTIRKNGTWLLIHGDTLSTIQGAFLGKIFWFQIGHIEAGLRSFNFLHPFPEEIDRVIASRFVDTHFCPNEWAVRNLKNHSGEKINTLQNTLAESLLIALEQKKLFPVPEVSGKKYFVFVMHRQENLFNSRLVDGLIGKFLLSLENKHCVFILHEFTKSVLEQKGLLLKLEKNKNITLVPRLPYVDFMQVLNAAEFVITDGGSNQEECYYLGKPTLLLRNVTERIEGIGENIVISKNNQLLIDNFIMNYAKYGREPIVQNTAPSRIIIDYILSH